MSKKKTYDQKIEEYMEKLKTAQKEKKEFREGTPELTYYRKDGYLYAFDNKTDFLKAIFKLNSAGETEGPAIIYYEDGKILDKQFYKNGEEVIK